MTAQLRTVEQEIKRLNAQSHDPSSADILVLIQLLVNTLKTEYPKEI